MTEVTTGSVPASGSATASCDNAAQRGWGRMVPDGGGDPTDRCAPCGRGPPGPPALARAGRGHRGVPVESLRRSLCGIRRRVHLPRLREACAHAASRALLVQPGGALRGHHRRGLLLLAAAVLRRTADGRCFVADRGRAPRRSILREHGAPPDRCPALPA